MRPAPGGLRRVPGRERRALLRLVPGGRQRSIQRILPAELVEVRAGAAVLAARQVSLIEPRSEDKRATLLQRRVFLRCIFCCIARPFTLQLQGQRRQLGRRQGARRTAEQRRGARAGWRRAPSGGTAATRSGAQTPDLATVPSFTVTKTAPQNQEGKGSKKGRTRALYSSCCSMPRKTRQCGYMRNLAYSGCFQ